MNKIIKISFTIFLIIFSININATEIKFGVYTSDKASVMYKKFKPIIDYLEENAKKQDINLKIIIKIYPTYESALEGIINGKYDFARFGPSSYIIAKQKNSKIRLLVKEEQRRKTSFSGVFIVKKYSDIKSIKDFKNKSFAFGDKHSTIGRYLAQDEMLKSDINSNDLKNYEYLGRHDKVALSVANGNFDAGVIKESTYLKYKYRGITSIATFSSLTKPWLVRAGFDDKLYNILKISLLKLKDKEVLKSIKKTGFIEGSDDDYTIIKKSMDNSSRF